jgi:regulatory protein
VETITDLKSQRCDNGRVNVFLDGDYAFSLAYKHANLLTVGQGLSLSEMDNLLEADQVDKAYEKAIRFIEYRPRSVLEVHDRLVRYGVEIKVIEKVTIRLQVENVLNDTKFAMLWVENRRAFRPRGKLLLHKELVEKGINDSDIENALSEVDELPDALQLVYSKLSKYDGLSSDSFRNKIWSLLARRGFDYSVINDVISEIIRVKRDAED